MREEAHSAKKLHRKASCQTKLRTSVGVDLLLEKSKDVPQNVKKMKNDPSKAKIAEC